MKTSAAILMILGLAVTTPALSCEYKEGETKFLDYAHCLYGKDGVQVVNLPEDDAWDHCIYRVQAFMPSQLLAITREKDGKEEASINCRGSIGNPCYLMKSRCDAALKNQSP